MRKCLVINSNQIRCEKKHFFPRKSKHAQRFTYYPSIFSMISVNFFEYAQTYTHSVVEHCLHSYTHSVVEHVAPRRSSRRMLDYLYGLELKRVLNCSSIPFDVLSRCCELVSLDSGLMSQESITHAALKLSKTIYVK